MRSRCGHEAAVVARLLALAEELDGETDEFGYQIRNGLKPGPGERIRTALEEPDA